MRLTRSLPHLKPGASVRFAFLPDGLDPDDLIRQSGADAMEECLGKTKSLVDMLWEREWSSGDWSTPERRAQLEKQLRELITRIADPNVKNHYGQDIRDRLFHAWSRNRAAQPRNAGAKPLGGSYYAAAGASGGGPQRRPAPFGGQRGDGRPQNRNYQGGRPGMGGQQGYGQFPPMPSESLKNSRLVTGDTAAPPAREALLVIALVNHPWLLEDQSEEISTLDLTHKGLSGLRDALLGILTQANSDAPLLTAPKFAPNCTI